MTGHEIREKFLAFFESKDHRRLHSASLNPATYGDHTTALTSAGMQPFMPFFKGERRPPHTRLVTAQKCCRADDIDEVGRTWRHCTFFEMLGNFSFGDYFKKESIAWGWEWVAEVLQIDRELLWVTVYTDDDEAAEIWHKVAGVPPERILRFGKSDNWWGLTLGPCGPCTEIFVDRGLEKGCGQPDCGPNCKQEKTTGCDRWGEIWNHVFQQFNRQPDGSLPPLPKPGIDTGAGLERIAAFLQGSGTIFDTDLLRPLGDYIRQMAEEGVGGQGLGIGEKERLSRSGLLTEPPPAPNLHPASLAVRIISDHLRAVTFLLGDDVMPSNEGRGYVLRRFLRRAFYYGWMSLGLRERFLHKIVPVVVNVMKAPYPELTAKQDDVVKWVRTEEERFHETLERGITLLEDLMEHHGKRGEKALPGAEVFRLYDTYGFPKELTVEITGGRGFTVDEEGFARAMEEQRERARAISFSGQLSLSGSLQVEVIRGTEFLGYQATYAEGCRISDVRQHDGDHWIVLDKTPFYAEAGGQVGDTGELRGDGFLGRVKDTQKVSYGTVHITEVLEGEPKENMTVTAEVDAPRRAAIRRAHSATHLLHKALRTVLGGHATQQGSLVRDDYLRFDFSHFAPVTPEELQEIERLVNEKVLESLPVRVITGRTLEEAKAMGAMALFEAKYGETVRMIALGDEAQPYSLELCGGTHLQHATSEIGLFKIIGESSVGANLRRIEALTGAAAYRYQQEREAILANAAGALNTQPERLPEQVEHLRAQVRDLGRQLQALQQKTAASQADTLLAQAREVDGLRVVAAKVGDLSADALGTLADQVAAKGDTVVVVLGASTSPSPPLHKGGQGGVALAAKASKAAVGRGAHAGNLIREVAKMTGGGGGGRPDFAQAGGRDASKLDAALSAVPELVRKQVALGGG